MESKRVLKAKPIRLPKKTFITPSLKRKQTTRVGETGNFVVDYDSSERLVLLYGKEAPSSHGFKLGLDKKETTAIINILKQAKTHFQ